MTKRLTKWIQNIIENYNKNTINKIDSEFLIDLLELKSCKDQNIISILENMDRRENATLLNYLLEINKEEVINLLKFSDIYFFMSSAQNIIQKEIIKTLRSIWDNYRKLNDIIENCPNVWEIYYYDISQVNIIKNQKDDYIKLTNNLYYSVNQGVFRWWDWGINMPPEYYIYFMEILIIKKTYVSNNMIMLYIKEKSNQTILSSIDSIKWNLLKWLRNNSLLGEKEDFLKCQNHHYAIRKYV